MTFSEFYDLALKKVGSYNGGIFFLKLRESTVYYVPYAANKSGSFKGLQVDSYDNKRKPDKATIKNQHLFGAGDPGTHGWKKISPDRVPPKVLERFAERAEEDNLFEPSNARLVGDPMPIRQGIPMGGGRGILTKGEMEKVVAVLEDAHGRRVVNRAPGNDEDLWTAFVSLLRGGYIRESAPGNQTYVLTDMGAAYLEQLWKG